MSNIPEIRRRDRSRPNKPTLKTAAECARRSTRTELRQAMRRPIDGLKAAIVRQDPAAAAAALKSLAGTAAAKSLAPEWLAELIRALETGNWDVVGTMFSEQRFVGPDGDFLVVAPYLVRRDAGEETSLSFIYGQILPLERVSGLDQDLENLFGQPTAQPVTVILPIRALHTAGNIAGEGGEAFIVPDGWRFDGSHRGPALNNMTEQSRRFAEGSRLCIRQIFDRASADLLLAPLVTDALRNALQHLEYQYHEAGHASGLGLSAKFAKNLIPSFWLRAVEEWRADGVAFSLAKGRLSAADFGRVVASNFCTRFGLDAHRQGGEEKDTDVNACEIALKSLLENEAVVVRNRRLVLRDLSYEGLARAVDQQINDAIHLTRSELRLEHPEGIQALYPNEIDVPYAVRTVFKGLVVEPCRGIFRQLR